MQFFPEQEFPGILPSSEITVLDLVTYGSIQLKKFSRTGHGSLIPEL
jgi:hypothetical protein